MTARSRIAAVTLIRRVLPALGVTLFSYFGIRLIFMGWLRQHYMTPVTTIYSLTANPLPGGAFWQPGQGFRGPNGPISLPNGNNIVTVGNGFPLSAVPAVCRTHPIGGPGTLSCLSQHGYLQYLTYQPAMRYWPFQFIEAGIFVAIAAALIAVTFAVINRRDA